MQKTNETDEPMPRTKELRKMLGILVGLLAGLAGLLVALLATPVMMALGPVLSLYQSIAGIVVAVRPAGGSASTQTHSDRDAEVKSLPDRKRNIEEPPLAA